MNTPIDDGGPVASIMTLGDKGEVVPVGGLSIRDWFAGMALQGILAQPLDIEAAFNPKLCAQSSYEFADAMLAARKEKP